MANLKAPSGQHNGIQWRTTASGQRRYRGMHNGKLGPWRGKWSTHTEAKQERQKYLGDIAAGKAVTRSNATLSEAWFEFIEGAKSGAILHRSGKRYKPSTLRGYERGWKKIKPHLGKKKLQAIKRADVQRMVEKWQADPDMADSTVRNSLDPLRALYRRAVKLDLVAVNPTTGVDVPRASGKRERIASVDEARKLIAALPKSERALWATAFYAGLRRGELQALTWQDVDLKAKRITVTATMDDVEGPQAPKSDAGLRSISIIPPLLAELQALQKESGRTGTDLVFGRTATEHFVPTTARRRALKAWKDQKPPLAPIKLHECRHTFASMLIAAEVNALEVSRLVGHSSIATTYNVYGKLMPDAVDNAGDALAKYVAKKGK